MRCDQIYISVTTEVPEVTFPAKFYERRSLVRSAVHGLVHVSTYMRRVCLNAECGNKSSYVFSCDNDFSGTSILLSVRLYSLGQRSEKLRWPDMHTIFF